MNDFAGYEEPTSRAFWGSEDLEEDSTTAPKFTLEWLKDSPSTIKTLVVVAGDAVSGITQKHIVHNSERVCTINSTSEFNVAAVYRLTDDVYVFISTTSVDITSAGELIQAISEITSKAEKIVAFTNVNMSQLHGGEGDITSPIVWRSLSTKKGKDHRIERVQQLKHPNFIAGVAAGVVAYAEMVNLPATVYIMYVSDDAYEKETIEPMRIIFSEATECPVPELDLDFKTFNTNKLKLYI